MQAPQGTPEIRSTTWFVRGEDARRLVYPLLAVIVGLAYWLGWEGAQQLPAVDGDVRVRVDNRFGPIIGVLAGFMVGAVNWVLRGAARDWGRIGAPDLDRSRLTERTFASRRGSMLLCGAVGLLMGLFQLWATGDLGILKRGAPAALVVTMLLVILFWMLVVQVAGIFIILIRGFYLLGREVEPDLFRMKPLAPFSYVGLRILAVNATSMAILIFMVGLGDVDLAGLAVPLGFTALVSVFCFLVPQLGVRQSIERARAGMLAQLDKRLDATGYAADGALESEDTVREVASVAILRDRIEDAPSWPISGIGWLRFTVLMLLPAVSWGADKLITRFLS